MKVISIWRLYESNIYYTYGDNMKAMPTRHFYISYTSCTGHHILRTAKNHSVLIRLAKFN